jgi:hypothetical protein
MRMCGAFLFCGATSRCGVVNTGTRPGFENGHPDGTPNPFSPRSGAPQERRSRSGPTMAMGGSKLVLGSCDLIRDPTH